MLGTQTGNALSNQSNNAKHSNNVAAMLDNVSNDCNNCRVVAWTINTTIKALAHCMYVSDFTCIPVAFFQF